jgi:membrane protease YdiL (CAAX protease family)
MLVAILPALPAMQPDVELDALLAAVPLCGPSLALRDALRGDLRWGVTAWSMLAHVGWSWLALSRLAGLLDAEKLLQSHDDAAELAARRVRSRRALRFGFGAVLAVYVVGGGLQQWNAVWGLVATLLVLLPVLALWCARSVARPEPVRWRAALMVRTPRIAHVAAALCLAPPLVLAVRALIEWQMGVLPIPSSMMDESLVPEALRTLGPVAMVLVWGLAPGIGEELFFRGAVLAGLRRDLSNAKVIAWQALLFGAVHASLYRFLPTALLGALLAALTLRARSLFPAVLLHASYNALAVLSGSGRFELPGWTWALVAPGLLLALVPGPRADRN